MPAIPSMEGQNLQENFVCRRNQNNTLRVYLIFQECIIDTKSLGRCNHASQK